MKRTNLTTAVIAGIAGIAGISNMANAVYLNADGTGQVLIYPYYTVNKGNATALTVVNTTSQGKAVKVRHIEGYNSREVLDYNLYMSPYDVWVAEIVAVGSGAGVFTTDNSCTVPKLPTSAATAQPFSTLAFTGASSDGGPTSVSRTLEGYTELIEMGVVTNANDGTLTAITHANGVPANCAQLVKAWSTGGYWLSGNVNNDITAASGGLFGSGTIVNVALGTVEGYNADAIDNFWTGTPAFEHDQPGSLAPESERGRSVDCLCLCEDHDRHDRVSHVVVVLSLGGCGVGSVHGRRYLQRILDRHLARTGFGVGHHDADQALLRGSRYGYWCAAQAVRCGVLERQWRYLVFGSCPVLVGS